MAPSYALWCVLSPISWSYLTGASSEVKQAAGLNGTDKLSAKDFVDSGFWDHQLMNPATCGAGSLFLPTSPWVTCRFLGLLLMSMTWPYFHLLSARSRRWHSTEIDWNPNKAELYGRQMNMKPNDQPWYWVIGTTSIMAYYSQKDRIKAGRVGLLVSQRG